MFVQETKGCPWARRLGSPVPGGGAFVGGRREPQAPWRQVPAGPCGRTARGRPQAQVPVSSGSSWFWRPSSQASPAGTLHPFCWHLVRARPPPACEGSCPALPRPVELCVRLRGGTSRSGLPQPSGRSGVQTHVRVPVSPCPWVVLAVLGPLRFRVNFKMNLSISLKKILHGFFNRLHQS